MEFDLYQWVGFIGMAFTVWAYFLIQAQKTTFDSWVYLWLNLLGAILLIISLIFHFNLGSFLIEIFWIGITIFGMGKKWKKKKCF
ncbi:MAG: hypothetical protein CR967_03635 [Proteobacteria bacterium]|nr:MAG: hypothetical protein CR967_03635 [Pseudomonadota bacterium]